MNLHRMLDISKAAAYRVQGFDSKTISENEALLNNGPVKLVLAGPRRPTLTFSGPYVTSPCAARAAIGSHHRKLQ